MTLVWVGLAVVLLAAAVFALRPPRSQGGDQVDAFAAARAVTNRWSADPSSTPRPLRDFLTEQRGAAAQPAAPEE